MHGGFRYGRVTAEEHQLVQAKLADAVKKLAAAEAELVGMGALRGELATSTTLATTLKMEVEGLKEKSAEQVCGSVNGQIGLGRT